MASLGISENPSFGNRQARSLPAYAQWLPSALANSTSNEPGETEQISTNAFQWEQMLEPEDEESASASPFHLEYEEVPPESLVRLETFKKFVKNMGIDPSEWGKDAISRPIEDLHQEAVEGFCTFCVPDGESFQGLVKRLTGYEGSLPETPGKKPSGEFTPNDRPNSYAASSKRGFSLEGTSGNHGKSPSASNDFANASKSTHERPSSSSSSILYLLSACLRRKRAPSSSPGESQSAPRTFTRGSLENIRGSIDFRTQPHLSQDILKDPPAKAALENNATLHKLARAMRRNFPAQVILKRKVFFVEIEIRSGKNILLEHMVVRYSCGAAEKEAREDKEKQAGKMDSLLNHLTQHNVDPEDRRTPSITGRGAKGAAMSKGLANVSRVAAQRTASQTGIVRDVMQQGDDPNESNMRVLSREEVNRFMMGKISSDESVVEGIYRVVATQLNVPFKCIHVDTSTIREFSPELLASQSFPGLSTEYVRYTARVTIDTPALDPMRSLQVKTREMNLRSVQERMKEHHWVWCNEDLWLDIRRRTYSLQGNSTTSTQGHGFPTRGLSSASCSVEKLPDEQPSSSRIHNFVVPGQFHFQQSASAQG